MLSNVLVAQPGRVEFATDTLLNNVTNNGTNRVIEVVQTNNLGVDVNGLGCQRVATEKSVQASLLHVADFGQAKLIEPLDGTAPGVENASNNLQTTMSEDQTDKKKMHTVAKFSRRSVALASSSIPATSRAKSASSMSLYCESGRT